MPVNWPHLFVCLLFALASTVFWGGVYLLINFVAQTLSGVWAFLYPF